MADHDVHTEQFHFSSVNNVCRLCLNLVKTTKESRLYKKNYNVNDYKSLIYQVHGLDLSKDKPGTHSSFFL